MDITGIACDSRKIKPGNVFVAIQGAEDDGGRYIEMAVENGAVVIVAKEMPELSVPYIHTVNPRQDLACLAAKFYGHPADKLKLIGVTGTNGKTTVTYLIQSILNAGGYKTGLIGTNEITACGEKLPITSTTPTTPDAIELNQIFAEFVCRGVEYAVMEVSSHALELERVYGCRYKIGVFTNLTQDHLDFHKTMDRYLAAKKKLFDIADIGIINIDDAGGRKIAADLPCPVLTTGLHDADVMAGNIRLSAGGIQFDAAERGMIYPVKLAIPGKFSVYNGLSAIGACAALELPAEVIQEGLANAKGVCGRVEVVPTDTDYTVIIDYAHSPDGLEKILHTVRGFARGRVIVLFGCGGDRDTTKRPKMGKIAGTLADLAIVTSDNPRTENPLAIIQDILAGMAGMENYIVVPDRREAIREALFLARKDDVVVLAGKGQETYQIIGKEKIDFDERVIVHNILKDGK